MNLPNAFHSVNESILVDRWEGYIKHSQHFFELRKEGDSRAADLSCFVELVIELH